MELIRGLHNLRDKHRGCVLTIGNFDGLHRGHQALVDRTRAWAWQTGLPSAALTFEPSPREYFSRFEAPPRVYNFRSKLASLAASGIERTVATRFSAAIAATSAEAFVDELLVRKLGVAAVIVGHDFRYGCGRLGNASTLIAAGDARGFGVSIVDAVIVDGERASSTAVRKALALPDLAQAERFLGRPYSLLGRVRRGLGVGRQLGMRTANIDVQRPLALRQGIYAVRGRVDGRTWDGVASLGVRPTLGLTRCLLETHLFGEVGDIYGHELEVIFCAYIRPELRFDSMDALAAHMQQDAADARAILGRLPPSSDNAT